MRSALEGRAAPATTLAPRLAGLHLVAPLEAAVAGLAVVAVLAGGGSDADRVAWIGVGAIAILVAALVARASLPAVGRAGAALVLLVGGLVLWSGVSILWSIEPDRTWDTFNRGVAYVALLALGAFLSPRRLAGTLAVVAGVAIVWALAGKVVPALGPDEDRSARLLAPVGYWNALALLVAMSLPLWLWLAARRRDAATALLFLSLVALALTTSRGGILVAVVAVTAWLALTREVVDGAVALTVAVVPGAAVAAWALSEPAISEAGVESRAGPGALLGLMLVAGAVLAAGVAGRLPRPGPRAGRRLAVAGAVAVVAVLAAVLVRVDAGAAWDEFRNPPSVEVSNDPSRLAATSSNHRWTWWTQAWQIFEENPVLGTGSGSYELARRPLREDTRAPLEPHNLALAALSETGLVGFLFLAGAVVAAVAAAAGALRRLDGPERAAAAALTAACAAWLAHALVDMPWQYVAVTAPLVLALGSLAAAGRAERPARIPRLPALAVALVLAASLALPALASARVDAALSALVAGDARGAEDAAEQAQALNPLAVQPILVEAAAHEFRGELAEAQRLYRRAVELQPRNPDTWYELGRFEFEARCNLDDALLYLDRSYALDSWPPDTGRLLNEVRDAVAAGGCPG